MPEVRVFAPDPGETMAQVATIEGLVGRLPDGRLPVAVFALIALIVHRSELFEIFDKFSPEGRKMQG